MVCGEGSSLGARPGWVAPGGLGSNCIETSPSQGRRRVPSTAGPSEFSGVWEAAASLRASRAPQVPAWCPSLVRAALGPCHVRDFPTFPPRPPPVCPLRPPSRSLLPEAGVLADPFPTSTCLPSLANTTHRGGLARVPMVVAGAWAQGEVALLGVACLSALATGARLCSPGLWAAPEPRGSGRQRQRPSRAVAGRR